MRVIPSPNVWHWPEIYVLENRAQDVHGAVWAALWRACPWDGKDVADIGCGDGFHLPRFAEAAASVVGIEPHAGLVARARRRVAGLPTVDVRHGYAQSSGLPANSVDLVHARTAYFFGPGCEPGLAEADRILRCGGTLAIIDLDPTAAPYGGWMRADLPHLDPHAVAEFFAANGFHTSLIDTVWRFCSREALESVLGIEFSAAVAQRAVAATVDLTIPVRYVLRTRVKSTGILMPRLR